MAAPSAGNSAGDHARLPIRMLHDRVLVEAEDGGERRSTAGIVIPATAAVGRRLGWASVVAIGQHVRQVQIGDRVLYDAAEQHPILREVRLDVAGIATEELQRRASALEMEELERAVRTVLVELLAVLGRLTAGVLTPPLHAALSDDGDEGSAT